MPSNQELDTQYLQEIVSQTAVLTSPMPVSLSGDAVEVTVNITPATSIGGNNHKLVATTNTAVQLQNVVCTQGVVIAALPGNAATIYVGNSGVTTSNGLPLPPGAAVILSVNNADLVYINGTSGDGVGFVGI